MVYKVYGIYDITNDLAIETPSYIVNTKYNKRSGIVEYSRTSKSKGETVLNKVISGGIRLHINPVHPILLPICMTRHILVIIENPVSLAPGDIIEGYITIPVDIAVYVEEYNEAITLIDIFTEGKIKYTLYGPLEGGHLARYHRTRFYSQEPRTKPFTEALVRITISNRSTYWITLSKILIDCKHLKLYYDPPHNAYAQALEIVVTSRRHAKVIYSTPFKTAVIESQRPPMFRFTKSYLTLHGTLMKWGV